ncbi:unnamed protein product [Allacma fusca]|uniref:Uncharacterized protein n=1 Tax=Allacma fusca TaxID=39272 RepID=A0A8J2K1A1_9HEXA|nr:unnamed protein product [Allacma fusca]
MKPWIKSERFLVLFIFLSFVSFALSLPSQLTSNNKPMKKVSRKVSDRRSYSKLGSGPERYDDTINEYLTERTCWWNEMCKEEFSTRFRCRCPLWSFCSSPGRYYNAYCTMSGTGYLWSQPKGPSFFGKGPYKMRRIKKSE